MSAPAPAPLTLDEAAMDALRAPERPSVGDLVYVKARGKNRRAIIRKVGPKNATVEFHTPSAYTRAVERKIGDIDLAPIIRDADERVELADAYEAIANVIDSLVDSGEVTRSSLALGPVAHNSLPARLQSALRDACDPDEYSDDYVGRVAQANDYRDWAASLRRQSQSIRERWVTKADEWNALSLAARRDKVVRDATMSKAVRLGDLRVTSIR